MCRYSASLTFRVRARVCVRVRVCVRRVGQLQGNVTAANPPSHHAFTHASPPCFPLRFPSASLQDVDYSPPPMFPAPMTPPHDPAP